MKKLLLILLLTFSISGFSQSAGFILLKKINGIEIYEKKTKTKTNDKHDYWTVEFEYINTTQNDLYYNANLNKNSKGAVRFEDYSFCSFELENKKTLDMYSDLSAWIQGEKTRLKLDTGETILVFKKNKTYSKKMEYKITKNNEPFLGFRQNSNTIITDNIYEFL